jgi:hypothetical protein
MVIYQSALYRPARIIYVTGYSYDIQFQDGRAEIMRNVSRQHLAVMNGCNSNVCVGDSVINTALTDEIVYNRILGITHDGLFVVNFEEGRSTNGRSWGWHESYLARSQGCMNGWCVGDNAYSRLLQANVRVLGHQPAGLVLEISSGRQRGMRVKFYQDQLSRL